MDDIDKICVFCKQPTDGGLATVTVTRGLAKILSSSLERKDGLHEKVKGKVSICVHVQCRQNYTRPTSIKASSSKASTSSADSTTSFKLRATDRMFNFKNNCFLCGEETDTNLKYPAHRRRSVHNVQTLEIRDTVLHQCDTRNDDWGEIVKTRLLSVNDLVAPEARYHGDCYKDFLKKKSEVSAGRPKSGSDTAFQLLCESIENSDDSQFSMRELQDTMSRFLQEKEVTETYSDYHLKNLLLKHFGDRMIVSKVVGKTNVFCLAETAHKIIETWYTDRDNDPQTERLRIVLAAADIVREDIQKKAYESNVYPDVEDILSGGENLVPSSLKLFTQRVIQNKKKKGSSKVNRTCNAVNHAIISAVRPRSFLSPLHIGLSLTLHRLYGSKHLIDLLSSMGVCASYYESSTYLNSLINAGSPDVGNDCFIQHVFDNADVNVRTLDGLDTFHSMGGIQCITPGKSVDTKIKVDKIQSGSINSKLTEIRTLAYPRKKNASLKMKAVDYDDLKIMVPSPTHLKLCLFPLNIMWTVGLKNNPGWNGFMHVLSSTKSECDSTYILALPFINMDPSNMSTIYSALCFAVQECRKRNQSCVVTFDQPLFLKSSEIVQNADPDSDLSKVILRLGGFHLLMSYMGSIGRIMEGSGLEKLWESVYGHNTVNHMLSGHAYSRSIRAFTLTTASLVIVLREQYPQLDEQLKKLESVYDQLLNHERDTEDFETNPSTYQDISRIEEILDGIRNSSRTAKLWINLITCVDLMLRFIFAERTGNWDIHLHTCLEMLPYFHAAGHLPYAKSAHIYAQEMLQLESKLTKEEFQLFTKKGYFTVRRKGHFWSGVWTDMSIEQSLMRPMKSIGGLTHGRGFSDSTLSKWILGTPYCLKIHEAVEEYLDCSLTFNEQHVELRLSRKRRDECDIEKFTLWLRQYNPFTKLSGDLVSLASGFVSNENVNCDNAYEVGVAAMKKMSGISFGEMKLHRKDMVVTQATHKTVMVRSKAVTVNPQQLFNRILCVCETPNKLKKYLEYELACTPPSMFDDLSLRKGAKSTFTKVFSEGIIEEIPLQDAYIVVDGGFLLHYVPWPSEATYGDIVQNYCSFVLSRYGRNCTVVFDGYPDEPTTKEQEQSRRSLKNSSCSIDFESHTKCLTKKELFLSNKNNKKKIIMALSAELAIKNINSVTAEGDADVAIVRTGLNNAEQFPATIVVGSDTDLLVLLVALAPENKSVYFCKMTAGKNSSEVYYSIQKLITQHSTIRKHLLFAHAVSGCDTTSALFGVGKIKAADLLKNDLEARCIAGEFIKKEASREKLLKDGERFLLAMYGLSTYSSLSEARYFRFTRLTSKSSLRSNFDLAKLPPTSEAAYQHLLRVYLQVQWWLDNPLQPTEWGWRHEHSEKTKSLRPVPNSKVFAPDDLLRLVSCKCKTPCGPYCGCRKSGMNCSSMCEICNGLSCLNAPSYDENIDSLMDE